MCTSRGIYICGQLLMIKANSHMQYISYGQEVYISDIQPDEEEIYGNIPQRPLIVLLVT